MKRLAGIARGLCSVAAVVLLSSVLVPASAQAVCVDPPGDITGNSTTNVADALCVVLVSLWQASGQNPATPPPCLQGPIFNADSNCDGEVNVADAIVVVSLAVGNALSTMLDPNQNGCVEVCESVQLPGPPVVVPAFVHGTSTGGGLRLQALGTGASAVGASTGVVGGTGVQLQPHPVAK
jgi:hypothetical protein